MFVKAYVSSTWVPGVLCVKLAYLIIEIIVVVGPGFQDIVVVQVIMVGPGFQDVVAVVAVAVAAVVVVAVVGPGFQDVVAVVIVIVVIVVVFVGPLRTVGQCRALAQGPFFGINLEHQWKQNNLPAASLGWTNCIWNWAFDFDCRLPLFLSIGSIPQYSSRKSTKIPGTCMCMTLLRKNTNQKKQNLKKNKFKNNNYNNKQRTGY